MNAILSIVFYENNYFSIQLIEVISILCRILVDININTIISNKEREGYL